MARNALLHNLGIEHPVFVSPMAGGPSTPKLAAAVSNAGGLGFLAGAYLTPAEITEAVRHFRALSDRPFGINLFAGGWQTDPAKAPESMLSLLGEIHYDLGLAPPELPAPAADPFPAQFEAVLEARPAVFSFTFGIPRPELLDLARRLDILCIGTATTVEEAQMLTDAGIDAIAAQGAEAGAHRGTFTGNFETAMVPTMKLVRDIVAEVRTPVIACGGLMDGRDIGAALAAGAAAAQLGTAFLACPESGASEPYKRALLAAKTDTTVITRAFSGRPARGLRNGFIQRLEGNEKTILPYPMQNSLTRAMRAAAAAMGNPQFLSLWAGQGVSRLREMPAGDLVRKLVQEMGPAAAS
jgi:nitronate monooxygenase